MKTTRVIDNTKEILAAMEVGEERTWPLTKIASVRSQASTYGMALGRRFRTLSDRENDQLVVIRIS